MFKVVSPMDTNDGGTYWLRCGSAFVNKDNSINVYLDAVPVRHKQGEGVKLQLREFTDEELKERAEKRASYSARATSSGNMNPYQSPAQHGPGPLPGAAAAASADAVPF